ncbi:ABC transporter permease, partial [Methylibium sp.]|uniref:MlaE family ABC transporter permease n=1 Tax=Methylibium sp. TaxID=2067992 RepID=UPI00286AB6FA
EMAAVITAVVMAGRTGAAFAAELATMQANEEIDALEVLGIDPVEFLVLPRVMALVLMMPLLYVYACATGLIGGLLVGAGMLGLPPAAYVERTLDALEWSHLGLGMAKSLVFGALIALTGCYQGLYAERNAAGVGQATTRAVVTGIVGVIALDAVFALCANALGI